MHTVLSPLMGTVYIGDFIWNDRKSNGSMIFDDDASCTRGRDPSLVGVDSLELEKVVLFLSTARAAR
jgi:hypothetical protein